MVQSVRKSSENKVLWINDVSKKDIYSNIKSTLFLGLHPVTRSPIVLNYPASLRAAEISFELSSAWSCFKQWMSEERVLLATGDETPYIHGCYRLGFNRNMQLIDIDVDKLEETSQHFVFPAIVNSFSDLAIDKIIKSSELSELVCQLLSEMIANKETQFYLTQPTIVLRLSAAGERIDGFSMLVKIDTSSANVRTEVSLEAIQYAMTPLSFIKHTDTEWDESVFQDNMVLLQSKESLVLPFKDESNRKKSEIKNSSASASCLRQMAPKSSKSRPNLLVHIPKQKNVEASSQKGVNAKAKNLMKLRSQFSQQVSVIFDNNDAGKGQAAGRSISKVNDYQNKTYLQASETR